MNSATKRCGLCQSDKPFGHFYAEAAKPDGLGSHCRQCKQQDSRERYASSSRASRMLRAARSRACRHGFELSIDLAWVEQRLEAGVCEVSGIPFVTDALRHPFLPSLDRVDSSRGYTPDNCRAILWMLNAAKQELPEAVFRLALQQIARAVHEQG